ncbi:MAG: hypothetical protein FWF52_00315 [Candidatus Azobacteroides sp.]|nr:hypothetical protein [Candidatus Azobacteroides sp.]
MTNFSFPELNDVKNKLSNWDRPGGTTAKIVAGLLVGGGLMVLYKILPFLITLASNVVTLILLCVAIALIIWLFTDKNIRRMVSVSYFMLMRKLTGLLIEIDPIAIVERRIRDMRQKIQEISGIMGNLKGLIVKNESNIKQKKTQQETEILKVKEYRVQNEIAKAQVANNQVKRLDDIIKTYIAYNEQSKKWYEILKKLEEMSILTVQDTENEVELRKEQFKLVKEQHKAFKSVMSILKGDDDEVALFTEAMDYMANDISLKLGEMENVIDSAGGLLDEHNINNNIISKQAAEIIERYDKFGIDGMFENFGKKNKIAEGNTTYIKNIDADEYVQYKEIESKELKEPNAQNRYFE